METEKTIDFHLTSNQTKFGMVIVYSNTFFEMNITDSFKKATSCNLYMSYLLRTSNMLHWFV